LNDTTGEHMFFSGSVKDINGNPISGAIVNVVSLLHFPISGEQLTYFPRLQWQSDGDGFYDVNSPTPSPVNNRGKIKTLHDGTIRYRGILPTAYPIVGETFSRSVLYQLEISPEKVLLVSSSRQWVSLLDPEYSPTSLHW